VRDRALSSLLASVGLWPQSRHERSVCASEVEAASFDEHRALGFASQPLVTVLDAIPQLIWISDSCGRLSYVNRGWTEYTGLEKEQAVALSWFDVLHSDDVASSKQAWNAAVANRGICQVQGRMRRGQDGGFRWHLCRAAPHFDEGTDQQVWFGTLTDCDELKRTLQARDDAISAVSHDLRSPLTALKLRLESLLHQGSSDRKLRERVESAVSQAIRLEKLIDELLEFSRLLGGRVPLCQEHVELFECASQLIERIRPAVAERGANVHLSCSSPVYGYWDRARIEQVIASLLLNAIKRGAGNPIHIHVGSDDRLATLTVQDCCFGVDPAEHRQSPRRDARASSSDLGELGVGLYLAREIIVAHGGSIRVESRPGKGTAYTVELPKKSVASNALDGTL
jgi:PAS domain S-box-containing protein